MAAASSTVERRDVAEGTSAERRLDVVEETDAYEVMLIQSNTY